MPLYPNERRDCEDPSQPPHRVTGLRYVEQVKQPTDAQMIHQTAVKLRALAADGLVFTRNEYDVDRYEQIAGLAEDLMSRMSGHDASDIRHAMALDGGYVTPKVDVRGCLFDEENRILLMREKIDGKWSLPGGWADPGDSPALATEREMLEESGHVVKARRLIACWDREVQGHTPSMPVHVYKLFFLCEQVADPRPPDELETLDIGWFSLDDLPELSESRVLEHQLSAALAHHLDPLLPTVFD